MLTLGWSVEAAAKPNRLEELAQFWDRSQCLTLALPGIAWEGGYPADGLTAVADTLDEPKAGSGRRGLHGMHAERDK